MLIENPLSTSPIAFPVLECFHIAGFALAIGMSTLVDLRLLGIGLNKQSPSQIARAFEWWTLGGLVVAIFSGLLLFSTDPDMYFLNWSFLIKMVCLVLAVTFHYTIRRRAVFRGVSRQAGGFVACASIALWISIIFGGIFIAVVRPGLS
ncbi:MAG TPA: DUF6644 family protein [Bryobacteraceae bacterium]|nr:DUF6644 family protein [Bryobacteraceae bacterium]HUO30453.1 DUF6644 family protein [Bryobacteraceae bacterium]